MRSRSAAGTVLTTASHSLQTISAAEAGADLSEMGAEGRISGEIDKAAGGFYHISAPEGTISVEEPARGKVYGGYAVDGCRRERQ